jgi:hypothetical protein
VGSPNALGAWWRNFLSVLSLSRLNARVSWRATIRQGLGDGFSDDTPPIVCQIGKEGYD